MNIGERVRQIREMKGISLRELSRRSGVNPSYMSSLENGKRNNISTKMLKKIAGALGVPVSVLLSDVPTDDAEVAAIVQRLADQFTEGRMSLIPILGTVRAGQPIYAEQNIIGYDYIDKEKAAGGNLFELKVIGDSMDKDGIQEGDYVIVRQQFDVNNGDIAVVLIGNEEATIKRVYKMDGLILLVPSSTNPEHKPIQINPMKTDFRIIGKVIGLKRFFE